jgi:proline racemase
LENLGAPASIDIVDSHTEGEPTRVVVGGWPELQGDSMAARRDDLLHRHDRLRQAVVCEPRGHDALVGALLTPATDPRSTAGVIFFNNIGGLGMCGHGLIGVVTTLRYLGRLGTGPVRLDTPVGTVEAEPDDHGGVTFENVPAFCHTLDVKVDVPGLGLLRGDVVWGGNWFFLTEVPEAPFELGGVARLTEWTIRIRRALQSQGVTGRDGATIDHVELLGPPRRSDADACSFVLCPGLAWDRSPCGTGTSAQMAALSARGRLPPGRRWRQESLTGGLFEGWIEERGGELVPHIRGRAFITARATLVFEADDPLREGFTTAAP